MDTKLNSLSVQQESRDSVGATPSMACPWAATQGRPYDSIQSLSLFTASPGRQ
jgi:hypothetical protein